MAGEKGIKKRSEEVEKVEDILAVVSDKIPALIRGLIESVFSESAGREMGKAVAAFYSELKMGEIPDEVVIEMTKDYVKSFTNLGQIFKNMQFGKQ